MFKMMKRKFWSELVDFFFFFFFGGGGGVWGGQAAQAWVSSPHWRQAAQAQDVSSPTLSYVKKDRTKVNNRNIEMAC